MNQRPISLIETYHDGELPQSNSYVDINKDNIIITAIKRAEDGDGIIVRCRETNKVKTNVRINFPHWNRTIESEFGPCEIKTFHIPDNKEEKISETNLIEW